MRVRAGMSRVLLLVAMWLSVVASCQAALFNITYDDVADQAIGTSAIVGSGLFSFSGPATVGSFTLSSLPDLAFSASFGPDSFNTSHIVSNPNITGISIFDRGAGEFGLVFTGNDFGSLNLRDGFTTLAHEPTSAINDPQGLVGGNGVTNIYGFQRNEEIFYYGDYSATTASPVPAPASLTLVVLGLLGLANIKSRTKS